MPMMHSTGQKMKTKTQFTLHDLLYKLTDSGQQFMPHGINRWFNPGP